MLCARNTPPRMPVWTLHATPPCQCTRDYNSAYKRTYNKIEEEKKILVFAIFDHLHTIIHGPQCTIIALVKHATVSSFVEL